jgi:N-carbamoylputrescine amidase
MDLSSYNNTSSAGRNPWRSSQEKDPEDRQSLNIEKIFGINFRSVRLLNDQRREGSFMRKVTVAVTQMECSWNIDENVNKAEQLIRDAAGKGANVVLIQELFETPYFCIDQNVRHLDLAKPLKAHPTIGRMSKLAEKLGVVLPISFFERANQAFFNSVAIIDADGSIIGIYRKTHIPNAVGYQEKYYFNHGDTGFKVWPTRYGKIGIGICWDQWFPESARCMALMGAELLMYPSAIGSDPLSDLDFRDPWQCAMQGQAAANVVPLAASNRIGREKGDDYEITFFGSSFIADWLGRKVAEANRTDERVVTVTFDLDEMQKYRDYSHFFRDRRPESYSALLTLDGK